MLSEVTESLWSSKPNNYKLVIIQSVSLNKNTGGNEDPVKHGAIKACYFMKWFSTWKSLLDFVFPTEFIKIIQPTIIWEQKLSNQPSTSTVVMLVLNFNK